MLYMKRFLSLVVLFVFCGCGKSDDVLPVITLLSPTDNQVFTGGQTVNVQATLTDNEGIHMAHLSVLDNSTGGHLVHFEEHFDGKIYHLNQSFVPVTGRSYHIEIEATDHNDNV